MSRIGKQQIIIPDGVDVKIDNSVVIVKGPKGELKQNIHPKVNIDIKDNIIAVNVKDEINKEQRSLWGLFASLIINMIKGVTEGFSKQLEITGVGYKAAVAGEKLTLNCGFSHPVEMQIPQGLEVGVEGNVITVGGIDKQSVGAFAAEIRSTKKTEPYKGKGIKYVGEHIIRKVGKAAAAKGE